MGITVTLDTHLVDSAKTYSTIQHRSVPKQIEHWATIGRIAEENPEISYNVIKSILLGLADVKNDHVEKYDPDDL